ncbi:MAG: protoporphyrinogen oxidase [Meiothermus sp.]|nr:protoporphyrinogen oxidase [Meiothermus sp.]
MSRCIIIGGGMAGLSAAYYLQKLAPEVRVTLLEASLRLGGKIATVSEDGFLLEGGPDAVVRYKPWALELMKELGLEGQVVGTVPAKPSALIHNGQQALPIPVGLQMVVPGDLKALALTPLLSPFGKARALLDWIVPKGPVSDEAFGSFIQRRLGRQVWERLVAPLSGGIYGGDPAELSTLAAFQQLKDLEQRHGSLLRGALEQRKQRGTREAGQLFASLQGGLGNWVEALVFALGEVEIRLSTLVESIERQGDSWWVHTSTGQLEADALIVAVPANATARLLASLHPAAAAALSAIPYGDSATVSLAFRADAVPPRVGHGMLMAAGGGFSVRGFTWTDQKWAGRAPEGFTLARGYFSGVGGSEVEVTRMAQADLSRLWGRVLTPERTWVFRWPEGLPRYTVGHGARVQQALEAEQLPGLFLVGAAYHGVGLPEVVRMGGAKARAVADFVRRG